MPLSRSSPTKLAAQTLRPTSCKHAAVGGHALGHVEAQMARHQRFGQIEIEIVKLVAVFPADLDGVAKARGGKQRRRRAFALDQRVGHQRRAMDQRTALRAHLTEPFSNTGRSAFSTARLGSPGVVRVLPMTAVPSSPTNKHVGKRPADIDANAIHRYFKVQGFKRSKFRSYRHSVLRLNILNL